MTGGVADIFFDGSDCYDDSGGGHVPSPKDARGPPIHSSKRSNTRSHISTEHGYERVLIDSRQPDTGLSILSRRKTAIF